MKGRRSYEKHEVTTTLGELADTGQILSHVLGQPYTPGIDIGLYDRWLQTAQAVAKEVNAESAYDIIRTKLVKEYSEPGKDDQQYSFTDPEKFKLFQAGMDELRGQERKVSICLFTRDEIDAQVVALRMSIGDRFTLDWLEAE